MKKKLKDKIDVILKASSLIIAMFALFYSIYNNFETRDLQDKSLALSKLLNTPKLNIENLDIEEYNLTNNTVLLIPKVSIKNVGNAKAKLHDLTIAIGFYDEHSNITFIEGEFWIWQDEEKEIMANEIVDFSRTFYFDYQYFYFKNITTEINGTQVTYTNEKRLFLDIPVELNYYDPIGDYNKVDYEYYGYSILEKRVL